MLLRAPFTQEMLCLLVTGSLSKVTAHSWVWSGLSLHHAGGIYPRLKLALQHEQLAKQAAPMATHEKEGLRKNGRL